MYGTHIQVYDVHCNMHFKVLEQKWVCHKKDKNKLLTSLVQFVVLTDACWVVNFFREEITVTSRAAGLPFFQQGRHRSAGRELTSGIDDGTSFLGGGGGKAADCAATSRTPLSESWRWMQSPLPPQLTRWSLKQSAADCTSRPLLQCLHPQVAPQAVTKLLVIEVQVKSRWRHYVKSIISVRDGNGESQDLGLYYVLLVPSIWSLIKKAIEGGLVNYYLGQDMST